MIPMMTIIKNNYSILIQMCLPKQTSVEKENKTVFVSIVHKKAWNKHPAQ